MMDVVKKAKKQVLVKSEKDELMDMMEKAELPNVIKKAKRQEQAVMEKAKNKAEPRPPPEVLKEPDEMSKHKLAKMEEAKKQELPEVLTKAELTKLAGMLMEA